jgi:hypothetical protein
MVLATLIAAILPFLADAKADTTLATAGIYAAIGITIGSLVSSVGRSALR